MAGWVACHLCACICGEVLHLPGKDVHDFCPFFLKLLLLLLLLLPALPWPQFGEDTWHTLRRSSAPCTASSWGVFFVRWAIACTAAASAAAATAAAAAWRGTQVASELHCALCGATLPTSLVAAPAACPLPCCVGRGCASWSPGVGFKFQP